MQQKPVNFSWDSEKNLQFLRLSGLRVNGVLSSELSFVFGTYGETLGLKLASFELFGSQGRKICSYSAIDRTLRDNSELFFQRQEPCNLNENELSAVFVFSAERKANIGLWVRGPSNSGQLSAFNSKVSFSIENGSDYQAFVPLGFAYSQPNVKTVPVADRLAFAWKLNNRWIFFAAFLLSLGFAAIHLLLSTKLQRGWTVLIVGIAAFSLAASTSVFVLPFQAPDEPDHTITMANAMTAPALVQEFEALAKRTHLERIKFHPDEKLLSEDLFKPAPVAWSSHVAATELSRSGLSTRLWKLVAIPFSVFSGPEVVLRMRLLQSLIFAVFAAWSFWILAGALGVTHVLAWLIVPTVPFFAMHISNYGPLVSFTLLFSAAVTALVCYQKNPRVGFALGTSASLLLATSRSAWAFSPAIFVAILLGVVSKAESEVFLDTIKYWVFLCLGLALFWLVATPEFLQYTLGNVNSRLPAVFHEIVLKSTSTPVALPFLLVLALSANWTFSLIPAIPAPLKRKLIKLLCISALIGLFCSYALPYLKPQLSLPDIETSSKIPLVDYLKKSTVLLAGLFRLSNHDGYLSRTFFGGFGWLEAPLPAWTTSLILLIAAGGLISFLHFVQKSDSLGSLVRLAFVFVGLLLSVGLSAKGNWDESVNLHGRYLIPYYITLFSLCFSGYASLNKVTDSVMAPCAAEISSQAKISMWLLYCSAGLHVYSLWFNFIRYFG